MTNKDLSALKKGLRLFSTEIGMLDYITKAPYLHNDPKLVSFGIRAGDTTCLGGLRYGGRSSGCGYTWEEALLTTLGEVVERYCPAFYSTKDLIKSSYKNLKQRAVHPNELILFHPKQFEAKNFLFVPFTEDTEINWTLCHDLISGGEILYPASLIYMPYIEKEELICLSNSTGLAGHTDFYEAILIGLYEIIERDSFVITWMQLLDVPKIKINADIQEFLDQNYPHNFNFHFFDMTFDLEVPAIMGMCFGETEYGQFFSFSTAARGTYGEALHKVIKEMGQTIPYFRYLLGEKTDWYPLNYSDLHSFEDHSIFYLKRPELLTVFDKWRDAKPSVEIDFREKRTNPTKDEIKRILKVFDQKDYNVYLKNLTTPDVKQAGFLSIKAICPQLLTLSGDYRFYFDGGKRLYEIPELMGYKSKSFDELNRYPHPLP